MSRMSTRKVSAGRYVTSNGYTVVKVEDFDGAGVGAGWHLIDPAGEWCNTYRTKADAVRAAERVALRARHEGNYPNLWQ